MDWMRQRIEVATWLRFIVPLAALIIYSAWLFRDGGQYMNAMAAAGSAPLPETVPGFVVGTATAAFEKLDDTRLINDYIRFQLLDIPYAVLNFLALFSLIALALKKFNLGVTPFRFVLLLPGLYLIAEFIENPLLSVLADGRGAPAALIPLQQAMTTLKFGGSGLALIIALGSLAALVISETIGIFRKSP